LDLWYFCYIEANEREGSPPIWEQSGKQQVATFRQQHFDELARRLATNRLSRLQVLKSVVAGLLLAGPLGTLWSRGATAQTAGCVESTCTESAEQAHAACRRSCKRLSSSRKRKKCLKSCNRTYSNALLDCGCLIVNTNTTTNSQTFSVCEEPCTPQTLNDQANQNFYYSKLTEYLVNDGFTVDGSPTATVSEENGTMVHSLLSSTYSNPTRTNEIAVLYFDVQATGETAAAGVVWDKQQETLLYLLAVVDDGGQVMEVVPSAHTPQTSVSRAVSSASTPRTCNSQALLDCREEAATETAIVLATQCSLPCKAGVVTGGLTCALCISGALALYALKLRSCADKFGCGAFSSLFCKNNICCGLTETSCGATCCPSGQSCCNGTCCPIGSVCCDGTCCPSGQSCCGGVCVDTSSNNVNCGSCGRGCKSGEVCMNGSCQSNLCCFALDWVTGSMLVYTMGAATGGTCGSNNPMVCTPMGICCGTAVTRDSDGNVTGCTQSGFGDVGTCPPSTS
jgi:hypothetical protein